MKFSDMQSNKLKFDIASAYGADEQSGKVTLTPVQRAELDAMTPQQLLRLWAQWHLGSGSWADEFLSVWEKVSASQPFVVTPPPADFAAAVAEVTTPAAVRWTTAQHDEIDGEHVGEEVSRQPWLY